MRTTPFRVVKLEPNEIFVFGSNLAGRHGAGAARDAMRFGARYGIGFGLSGQTYAIPTKDENIRTLPLATIKGLVDLFLFHASMAPEKTFLVTAVGCGLAGYSPKEIAPFFKEATPNVILPDTFHAAIKTT